VDATGRKKLIMAGIVTGTCLSQSVLAALKEVFDVYFVSDCSGDVSKEAHHDAKMHMTQAGAKPITWLNLMGEWAPDYGRRNEPRWPVSTRSVSAPWPL